MLFLAPVVFNYKECVRMDSLEIIISFSITLLVTGLSISFITINSKIIRRSLKTLVFIIAMACCCLFVYSNMKQEPYIPDTNPIVYVTDTGSCYHNAGCYYLKSKNEIELYDAFMEDYYPCSYCEPLEYSKHEIFKIEESLLPDGPTIIELFVSIEYLISLILTAGTLCIINRTHFITRLKDQGHTLYVNVISHITTVFILFHAVGILVIFFYFASLNKWLTAIAVIFICIFIEALQSFFETIRKKRQQPNNVSNPDTK